MMHARAAAVITASLMAMALASAAAQTSSSTAPARRQSSLQQLGIGRPATPEEIAAWDDDVMADGTGLPPSRGTAADGAPIFAARCASCHGRTGKEGPSDVLVGAQPASGFPFSREPALPHTIGNYWPYATTVFDYIRRAMPPRLVLAGDRVSTAGRTGCDCA